MEKTSENLFEKYFSMYANAEANLLFNGFETNFIDDRLQF